jgi:hypothetical protein
MYLPSPPADNTYNVPNASLIAAQFTGDVPVDEYVLAISTAVAEIIPFVSEIDYITLFAPPTSEASRVYNASLTAIPFTGEALRDEYALDTSS